MKPFEVHINVDDFTIKGLFMQNGHLIDFESNKLSRAQLRWPIDEIKKYVMVSCLRLGNYTSRPRKRKYSWTMCP
jgi:hypothetical protein